MKKILKRLGFHSADEMERAFLFKAQRNAYIFLVISLVAWSLYESYKVYVYHSRLNPFPCFLLIVTLAVQTLSQFIMTHRATKDEEAPCTTGATGKVLVLLCVIVSIMATIGAAIVFMGARV